MAAIRLVRLKLVARTDRRPGCDSTRLDHLVLDLPRGLRAAQDAVVPAGELLAHSKPGKVSGTFPMRYSEGAWLTAAHMIQFLGYAGALVLPVFYSSLGPCRVNLP